MKPEARNLYQERAIASRNLIRLLRLPPESQTLVVSSQLPEKPDPQMTFQREMASELVEKIYRTDSRPMHFEFDGNWSEDELEAKTKVALSQLDGFENFKFRGADFQPAHRPTVVIYLGDGPGMSSVYRAIDKTGQSKGEKIRVVNLFGFTSEDARALSQATEKKMKEIEAGDINF